MSNLAFCLKASEEYYKLLDSAFLYYLDYKDFTYFVDDYRDRVLSIYKILNDPFNHSSGKYFINLCFLYEDDFYIFSDVIEFCIQNCSLSNSILARFYIMYNKFCADPEGQVIALC